MWYRSKESQWRWLLTPALIAVMAFLVMVSCTPNYYDGGNTEIVPKQSLIRLTVKNNRTSDPTDPRFYVQSFGKHPLGIIKSLETKEFLIERDWLGPDGCLKIIVHYTGYGDITSEGFCWSNGYRIDVQLNDAGQYLNAWAHP